MKKFAKFLSILLVLCMIMGLAACTQDPNPDPTPAPSGTGDPTDGGDTDPTDEVVAKPDLGGFQLIVANWWDPAEYVETEPTTALAQLVYDYRHELMGEMNFTYASIGLSHLGTYHDVVVNSLMTHDGMFNMFQPQPESITALASQGLLVDLSTIPELHLENTNLWSQNIIDYYTIGGKVYAARAAMDEPRDGIIFNKRMLEDAGLDPNLPYQLLQEGKWDWEHFEELCEKLTKDTNNDGVTDIYAFAAQDGDLLDMGIYTNGAMYVDRDDEGYFVDGTQNPAFQEGMEWAVGLIQKGYVESYNNPSASWDEDYVNFSKGKTAMILTQTWVIQSYFKDMADDYGFIVLPAGPNGVACSVMYPTPIAIPSYLDKETVTKAATAYYAYANTAVIEGIEDFGDKTYLDNFYSMFRDDESVEITVDTMMTDQAAQVYDGYYLVPNYNYWSYIVEVAKLNMTAAEAIETLRPENQAAIDAANALFGKN
jgi:ABC-type glycerol-3-phosphate transport system substrate-binding protein